MCVGKHGVSMNMGELFRGAVGVKCKGGLEGFIMSLAARSV